MRSVGSVHPFPDRSSTLYTTHRSYRSPIPSSLPALSAFPVPSPLPAYGVLGHTGDFLLALIAG
jgi:hypothetical protein